MAGKRPRSEQQMYAFRYWRRGLRKLGISLTRSAIQNGVQLELSGKVRATTFEPGKWLSAMREGRYPTHVAVLQRQTGD